jgi:Acetyltransferase (GNAT) domain
MPGTRHEPAATAPAGVATVRGWRELRALEPALDALHRTAGLPVTARLAWWRAALMADREAVPLLLALRGPGETLIAATLVALRDQDGECRITSVRPQTDDVWDVAAVSPGARYTVLAGLIRYAARLSCPWRLTLTGLRDGDEATWLAGQLPDGVVVPAPPVPGIGFGQAEVPLGPGIRSGLDRSGHRIRQHALTETIRFEREPGRLADMREEIEAVHLARDHDAGRVSDLDDGAGVAFWRSVYDGHAARGELEVATLRLDGHLAAYVVALADSPVYRVFDGRFAPKWRLYSPGRRLEVAVVEHARRRSFRELDWMSSVAPEKLVASTHSDPRWAVTAAGDAWPALPAGGGSVSMAAAP